MKKMSYFVFGVLFAFLVGFTIIRASFGSTSSSELPTQTQLNQLKSTYPSNNNQLTAKMRDTMVDFMGKYREKIKELTKALPSGIAQYCACDYRGSNGKAKCRYDYCANLDVLGIFFDDGDNTVNPVNMQNLVHKSRSLGKHTFCALTVVAFQVRAANNSDLICKVFSDDGQRYLYSNGYHGDPYCEATCF